MDLDFDPKQNMSAFDYFYAKARVKVKKPNKSTLWYPQRKIKEGN